MSDAAAAEDDRDLERQFQDDVEAEIDAKLAAASAMLAALHGEARDLRAQMKRTQGRYGENKRLEQVKKQIAQAEAAGIKSKV